MWLDVFFGPDQDRRSDTLILFLLQFQGEEEKIKLSKEHENIINYYSNRVKSNLAL